jgi:hypothetical protein
MTFRDMRSASAISPVLDAVRAPTVFAAPFARAEAHDAMEDSAERRLVGEATLIRNLRQCSIRGRGLWGHAHTNEELVGAARAEIARLRT